MPDYSATDEDRAKAEAAWKRMNPQKVEGAQYQPGLSFAQYRAVGEGSQILTVNSSLLKEPTPLHAKMAMEGGKDGPALALGDALHKAILEPQIFEEHFEDFYITSVTKTWDSKANERLALLYPDKIILTQDQIDQVKWMRDAIYKHHLASRLLRACDERELTGIAPDPETGIVRKIRVDGRSSRPDSQFLLDIKTARDLLESKFYYDARKFGYHVQGAYYLDTDAMITGRRRQQFIILGVTNCKPYYARVYTIPPEDLDEGRIIYQHRMASLVNAVAKNEWFAFEHESDPVPLQKAS
jgi:hypothetical protein